MNLVASIAVALSLIPVLSAADELPTAEPEAVGLSAEVLDGLGPKLEETVEEGQIPGAVALIARHGKVAHVEALGLRDIESKQPMTEDTIFAIASMTKPITCVAAMTLVEQGKLGLDDPVSKYLPELADLRVLGDPADDTDEAIATVPADRPVTIRHLFSHTSGIAYGGLLAADPRLGKAYAEAGVQDRDMETIAEQVERLAKVPLAHQPGEGWTYGLSHDVLGRVIEVVSGQPFDQYLQEHIFTPLDMRDTSFFVPESKRDRVATIYNAGMIGRLNPLPKNFGSETFFSGGGGLFSTARDYARFAQMLLNGGELDGHRILKAETLASMTTNAIGDRTAFGGTKYGLGFGLEPGPAASDGDLATGRYFWGGIFSTNFWVDPEKDLIALLMTQVLPTNRGDALDIFREAVGEAVEED